MSAGEEFECTINNLPGNLIMTLVIQMDEVFMSDNLIVDKSSQSVGILTLNRFGCSSTKPNCYLVGDLCS